MKDAESRNKNEGMTVQSDVLCSLPLFIFYYGKSFHSTFVNGAFLSSTETIFKGQRLLIKNCLPAGRVSPIIFASTMQNAECLNAFSASSTKPKGSFCQNQDRRLTFETRENKRIRHLQNLYASRSFQNVTFPLLFL